MAQCYKSLNVCLINHDILNKGKTFGRDLLLLIDRDYDHLFDYIVFSRIQQEYVICLKSITY